MNKLIALLLIVGSGFLVGCGTTNFIKPDYRPRLSSRATVIEEQIKSKPPAEPVHLLRFSDLRSTASVPDHASYGDNNLVWKGKGLHEYRFQTKTVADYLFESLVFDLRRSGIRVKPADGGTPPFSGTFDHVPSTGPPGQFILGVQVLECRPDYKTGWANITPYYLYEYRVKLWDAVASKIVLDETFKKKTEGMAVAPIMTLADLTDRLLNDELTDLNLGIIEMVARATVSATTPQASSPLAPSVPPKLNLHWEDDCETFVSAFDRDVRTSPSGSMSDMHDKTYAGKQVKWQLTFLGLREEGGKQILDFDMNPFGIRQKAFSSERCVWVAIEPATTAVSDWKKLEKGTKVWVEGTLKSTTFFKLGPSPWGLATVADTKPVEQPKQ